MLKKIFLYALLCFCINGFCFSQNGILNVTLNKQVLTAGDTLEIAANYTAENIKSLAYTLHCVIENETGKTIRYRWPMLAGQTEAKLLITDTLPKGHYTFYFALQPRFFKLYGMVNKPDDQTEINSSLMTSSGDWVIDRLPVADDGSFVLNSVLFEKKATVIFSKMGKKGGNLLDIHIANLLDSTFQPLALLAKEIVVGPFADTTVQLNKNLSKQDTLKFSAEPTLPNVLVIGQKKSPGEEFNETYSDGLFKQSSEQVISLLDRPVAYAGSNIFQFLQSHVAGIQFSNLSAGGNPTATINAGHVYFYLDEIRVEGSSLAVVPISDVAIIKIFQSPFFENPGADGSAICIYTRRGNYVQADNGMHVFQVNGYTQGLSRLIFPKSISNKPK